MAKFLLGLFFTVLMAAMIILAFSLLSMDPIVRESIRRDSINMSATYIGLNSQGVFVVCDWQGCVDESSINWPVCKPDLSNLPCASATIVP